MLAKFACVESEASECAKKFALKHGRRKAAMLRRNPEYAKEQRKGKPLSLPDIVTSLNEKGGDVMWCRSA
jgi:hypothetical protein